MRTTYIKWQILNPRIKWASTLAVYVSLDTWESEWVNWEIERAHKLGKRIIGIWQYGAKDCKMPEAPGCSNLLSNSGYVD